MKGIGYDLDDNLDVNQPYFKILGTITSIIKVDNSKTSFGKDKMSVYFKIKVQTTNGKSHFILFCYIEPPLKIGVEYVLQGYINSTNGINIYLNLRKAFDLDNNNDFLNESSPWNKPLDLEENNDVNQINAKYAVMDNTPLSTFSDETIIAVVKQIFEEGG